MNGQNHPPSPATQQGIVLLESLIAILIFSFGVLAIVGLQASMIKSTSDAKYRSEASYIAQQRIGQMWTDPGNLSTYIETATDISTLLPGGTRTVTQPTAGQPRFVVTVTWQQPGQDAHSFSTIASIVGG
ncbi:MAG: prepilin-type cleavage/methylation domain-containing protein [Betaproteobacteria bacterium]